MKKEKKKYQKWSDYERAVLVAHHKSFGRAAVEVLQQKVPLHSPASVKCELNRFDDWKRTGVMEFGCRYKDRNSRPGAKQKYIKIIKDLTF
jgi:hypothetical protein